MSKPSTGQMDGVQMRTNNLQPLDQAGAHDTSVKGRVDN